MGGCSIFSCRRLILGDPYQSAHSRLFVCVGACSHALVSAFVGTLLRMFSFVPVCLFSCFVLLKQAARTEERHDQIKRTRFYSPGPSYDSACDSFLLDVAETVKESCLANFIDRTGNAQTLQTTCIVCAGVCVRLACITFAAINFLLMRWPTVFGLVQFPRELSILSLPERILVAFYYPAAFVIKLYPQQKGARQWDTPALNSGLRGNVSTYCLNTQDICDMIQGDLLPRHPDILPAMIAVSMIGPHNLPAHRLPSTLSVNRLRIRDALQFLKKNNRLYRKYSDFERRARFVT